MPNKSSDWVLHIPTGAGAFDCLLPLKCGDIIDGVDLTNGQLEVAYQTDFRTGRHFSTAHYRTPAPSEITIQTLEETADGIDRLRKSDCLIPIQRRLLCGNDWSLVEHYRHCRFLERSIIGATANGTESRDDVPTVQIPTVFDGRVMLSKDRPKVDVFDIDTAIDPENTFVKNIVDIVYCDDDNCGYQGRYERPAFEGVDLSNPPSDGCQEVYKLFCLDEAQAGNGITFLLQISRDGGDTWDNVHTDISTSFEPDFMHCYFGRLFIGFKEDVFYCDFANVPSDALNPTEWTKVTDLNEPHQSLAGGTITVLAPSSGAFIVKMVSVDQLLVILYNDGSTQNGVAIAPLDHGETWETVLVPSIDNGTYYDMSIAGYGSVIVACGEDSTGTKAEIAFNYQRGKPRTSDPNEPAWFIQQFDDAIFGLSPKFIAIDIASYNPFKNRTVFSYVWNEYVDGSGFHYDVIYKSKEMTNWQEVYRKLRGVVAREDGNRAFLNSYIDSWVVWAHRNGDDGFGDSVIAKSIDGGCNWINMNKENRIYNAEGCFLVDAPSGNIITTSIGIVKEISPLAVPIDACLYAENVGGLSILQGQILIFDAGSGQLTFSTGSPLPSDWCDDNKILSIAVRNPDGTCPPFIERDNLFGDTGFDVCKDDPNTAIISGRSDK